MKNLPEKDFWSEVKTRLNNYAEMPDDDGWDRIAGALPKAKSTSMGKRWAGIVLIFLLGTSTGYLLHQYIPFSGTTNASLMSAVSSEDKPDESNTASNTTSTSRQRSSVGTLSDQDNSNRTALADNSPEGIDNTVPTDLSEREAVNEKSVNASNASSFGEETTDHQANHHAGKAKQQHVEPSHASRFSAFTPQGEKRSVENSDVYTEDQYTASIAKVNGKDMDEGSGETATTAGDRTSNISNNKSGESEMLNKGVGVSNQANAKQHDALADNVRTGSSDKSIAESSAIPDVDSAIVEKREVVAKVASGQNEKKEQKQKKEKRIFHADVYANITPSLSFQKITPSGNDDLRIIGLQSNGIMRGDRFGISLEAGFQRKLTPRLDFYAGLSYYRQKQTLTYEYNGSGVAIEQGDKNGQYAITPLKESKSFQYNMTNVGISSGVMYHLFGDKLMHKIGGGFQFQKGLLRMGSESSYNNVASFYFNYQLSYRLECQLNSKWNVYLQPTFIHSIISHEELTEPFTIKPYRAGLGIGAIYHF